MDAENKALFPWFVVAAFLAWAVLATLLAIDATDERDQCRAALAEKEPT